MNYHFDDYANHSKLIAGIVKLYSMESFLVYEVNKASRDKDTSKIATLGPFAWALGRVVFKAQGRRPVEDKIPENAVLFRGMPMTQDLLS
jgi:hypothetical protein